MGLIDKEVARAYEPYRKEALYSFTMILSAMIGGALIFIPWGKDDPKIYVVLGVGYPFILLLATALDFRLALLSVFEKMGKCYIKAEIQMIRITEEFLPSGKYESVIHKLYPKEAHVSPVKILCRTSDNKKLILRRAMSGKNQQLLVDEIWNDPEKKRTVQYGKFTHIIVEYCDKDDVAYWLNRRI